MVAGELDYIGAFGFSYAIVDNDVPGVNRPYQNTSLVVWVPFVILIPLVLNNMLVRFHTTYIQYWGGGGGVEDGKSDIPHIMPPPLHLTPIGKFSVRVVEF